MDKVKVVCLSNIHNNLLDEDEMPEGDILIIAGDATKRGNYSDFLIFRQSLEEWSVNYEYIIYVPGKHDIGMEDHYWRYHDLLTEVPCVHILINDDIVIKGLKIWGSPVSKDDKNWAFTLKDRDRENVFKQIPEDTDIVVTYSPAEGILDEVKLSRSSMTHMGCKYIREALERVRPQLHVCGSAHESYGAATFEEMVFINASLVDGDYNPVNKLPVVTVTTN